MYANPLTDDMVKIARTIPGVDQVQGFSSVGARIVRPDGTYVDVNFIALEDPSQLTLNLLKPAAGETTIPAYGKNETIF
ncbi:MAG: hypothetical protein IPL71_22905, partial [Anaerolineales bacterium]|uniref:hypothetical protein n=1 Tax=Candidatus Villigracilis proximus TaxID=3140683 RepID=UPI003135C8B7|nr:hypothetical protein [Anaerolineales bacterium]